MAEPAGPAFRLGGSRYDQVGPLPGRFVVEAVG